MTTQSLEEARLAASRVNICLGYERQLLALNERKKLLPVTIVSGFLGAGKTSLLHHILANRLNLQIACAVSDLASINVDELLVTEKTLFEVNINKRAQNKKPEVFGLKNRSVDALKDIVWKVIHESDTDFDYLIVETSGTTDPTQLVAAVQEKFGKMTRARLDSVVIVVDGDAMAQDAQQGIEPCVIAIQQLECADVVLLNKIDLLTDDAKQLAQDVIKKYAPLARVYETDHCEVYLPHILDISPPEAMNTAVITHETSNLHWNKGSETTVGRLRIVQDSNSTSSTYSHSSSHRHLDFKSVSFEQVQPIYLYQMHHWIDKQLPKGILRAKGVFYFADDPTNRFVFQLSGRKRIQIENTGRWISAPKNQFIVIGTQMDEAIVVEQLEATLASIQDDEMKDQQTRQENLTLLHQDDRFEIQQEECKYSVRFRLKCPTSGLDENMLRHHHHVDTNQLTKRLVEEVNSAGTGGLLAYLNHPGTNGESLFVAMASIYGPSSLQTMWKEIDTRAAFIITEVKRKLVGCKCGF